MDNIYSTLFVSLYPRGYSRTATILNSPEFSKVQFLQICNNIKSIIQISSLIRCRKIHTIVVASPSHVLVPFLRMLTSARIVLDAGWPLSDSNFTRGKNILFLVSAIKNKIIDFFAFQLADIVILESQLQKKACSSKYSFTSKKFFVSYTGLDETQFVNPKLDEHFIKALRIPPGNKIVLFRSKENKEAGYEFLQKVSHSLSENINLVICTGGQKSNYQFAKNTRIVESWLSTDQLRTLYLNSDLVLGQLSKHKRLARTIPHKVYEAAYFGKALLTFENMGVKEILNNSEAIFSNPASPEDFAATIASLVDNPVQLEKFENRIVQKQKSHFSQDIIAKNFFKIIQRDSNFV